MKQCLDVYSCSWNIMFKNLLHSMQLCHVVLSQMPSDILCQTAGSGLEMRCACVLWCLLNVVDCSFDVGSWHVMWPHPPPTCKPHPSTKPYSLTWHGGYRLPSQWPTSRVRNKRDKRVSNAPILCIKYVESHVLKIPLIAIPPCQSIMVRWCYLEMVVN